MIFRILGLIALYVGGDLIVGGMGLYPENFTVEWWSYEIGTLMVITVLYIAWAGTVRGPHDEQ